jgi:hypothetical protein
MKAFWRGRVAAFEGAAGAMSASRVRTVALPAAIETGGGGVGT